MRLYFHQARGIIM